MSIIQHMKYMMNQLKELMLFRLLIEVNELKKSDYDRKIEETEKEMPDHDKYFTTQEFNNLTAANFAAASAQAKLATKGDILDFVIKIDFDDKLKYFNKKVTSNKKNMLMLTRK